MHSAPARCIRQFVLCCIGRFILFRLIHNHSHFRLEGTPCSGSGSLDQVVQDSVQSGFEYFHWQKLCKLSEQLVSVSDCYHSKNLLSCVWIEFHSCNFFVLMFLSCFVIFLLTAFCPCQWVLLRRAWLPLLNSLASGIYTH